MTATVAAPADTLAVLQRLVPLLLSWSYEGTLETEEIVHRVAAAYGAEVEIAVLADSAVLTVGERTLAFARPPAVPPGSGLGDEGAAGGHRGRPGRAGRGGGPPGGAAAPPAAVLQAPAGARARAVLHRLRHLRAGHRPGDRLTPGSHGLRGLESWLGGHAIQGFRGVGDMVALFTALAVGMLVGAAAVRSR